MGTVDDIDDVASVVTVIERVVVVLDGRLLLVTIVAFVDPDADAEAELLLPGSVRLDTTTVGSTYFHTVILATVLLFTPVVIVNDEAFKQKLLLRDWTAVCTQTKSPALFITTSKIFFEVELLIHCYTKKDSGEPVLELWQWKWRQPGSAHGASIVDGVARVDAHDGAMAIREGLLEVTAGAHVAGCKHKGPGCYPGQVRPVTNYGNVKGDVNRAGRVDVEGCVCRGSFGKG